MPPLAPFVKKFSFSCPSIVLLSLISVSVLWMYHSQVCIVCTSQIRVFKNHLTSDKEEIGARSAKESRLNILIEAWRPVMPASQPSNIVPKSFHSISSLQQETVSTFP